jgi:hypothetical protein
MLLKRKVKIILAICSKHMILSKWRFRKTAMIFGVLLLGGCVGGPASYMKEVTTEIASPQPVQLATPQELSIAPVQTAALETPTQQAPSGSASVAEQTIQEPIINTLQSTQASSMLADGVIPASSNILQPQSGEPIQPVAQVNQAPNQLASLQTAYQDPLTVTSSGATNNLAPIDGIATETGFAIGTGGNEPFVDPLEAAAESRIPILYASMTHGQCKQGRGPKPRKINATNINPGDPYYIEIRMRHTPLLPVGHTYVAYGRLSPTGEILDEKLIMLAPFGGYAGAALASGIPMPGVLDPHPDDCRIRPKAAYRVSLNAQRYEKLLLDIQKARSEKPSYLLFTFNCNHFASRIAASVGIKPPANIYVPALEYIYAMIDENEGGKIARN